MMKENERKTPPNTCQNMSIEKFSQQSVMICAKHTIVVLTPNRCRHQSFSILPKKEVEMKV